VFERTITCPAPHAAAGRKWLAVALLEAPDVDGQPGEWTAIEAVPGSTDKDGVPIGVVPEAVATRHAQHDPGWYRVQWYDDGQVSEYSEAVRLEGPAASNRGRARR
jgi:hypothetical protein